MNRAYLKVGASVLLLAAAGTLVYFELREPPAPPVSRLAWFYDLNTDNLFAANAESPPIDAPSGPQRDGKPAGVRAYVFACGDCAAEKERQVAWLETFTVKPTGPGWEPDGRRRPAAPPPPESMATPSETGGSLVKKPEGIRWIRSATEQGKAIQVVADCPDGKPPRPCKPPVPK
ncbi:MAG: hypothetical protein NTW19_08790 [Planctomycetota bacterium]|nr:hypothetical protein [Planctomycetota bacterium]